QCGPSTNFRDDVALFLSPMFTPPPRIIRNSLVASRWGPEESFGGFPLVAGQPFELTILVESGDFRISVNGCHFTEFRHRIAIDLVTHISISGDVRVNSITIEASVFASASAPPLDMAPPYGAPYPSAMPP